MKGEPWKRSFQVICCSLFYLTNIVWNCSVTLILVYNADISIKPFVLFPGVKDQHMVKDDVEITLWALECGCYLDIMGEYLSSLHTGGCLKPSHIDDFSPF